MIGKSLLEMIEQKKEFVSSGSTLLDLALGGGWLVGGIANVIGDESTGKTLLALSSARKAQQINKYWVLFADAEFSLDVHRAVSVFKLDSSPSETRITQPKTVEEWTSQIREIGKIYKEAKVKKPCFMILDSLDALDTQRTQLQTKRDDDDSMRDNLDKSLVLSANFKRINRMSRLYSITVLVISQTRTRIGVMFGDKTDISGGKALKFYASQRVKLAEAGKIQDKAKRVVGIHIKAKVIKNKVAPPFAEAKFPVYFEKGIDDIESMVDYLLDGTELLGASNLKDYRFNDFKCKSKTALLEYIRENANRVKQLKKMVTGVWKGGKN